MTTGRVVSLKWLAKRFIWKTEEDYDAVTVVTGELGNGKSTFAIQLSKEICKLNLKLKPFSLDDNEIYSPTNTEIKEKVDKLPLGSPIILDEAVKSLSKYDWNTAFQKFINKYFSVNRSKNKIVFLLIPYFTDLTAYFRKYRCRVWIHIYAKGKGVIFRRSRKETSDDPYDIKTDEKIFDQMTKNQRHSEVGDELLINVYRRYKKYWREFTFEPLSKEEYNKYKELKDEYQTKNLQGETETLSSIHQRYKKGMIALVRHCYNNFKISQEMIGKLTGFNQNTISRYCNLTIPLSTRGIQVNNNTKTAQNSLQDGGIT